MRIIVDIDGTIADCRHRLRYVERNPKNWNKFFDEMVNDTPILGVVRLVRQMFYSMINGIDTEILLVSGRPDTHLLETTEWLKKYNIPYTALFMRTAGDYRADHIVKAELLDAILKQYGEIDLVLDDRQSVVDMWREKGLTCLQMGF